jgi:hypothetical protein
VEVRKRRELGREEGRGWDESTVHLLPRLYRLFTARPESYIIIIIIIDENTHEARVQLTPIIRKGKYTLKSSTRKEVCT